MLNATAVDSLHNLLTLVEYVSSEKNRVKELKELRDAHKAVVDERKTVEKAHGGARSLKEADRVLTEAQTTASDTLSRAEVTANQLITDANAKVGDLTRLRETLDAEAKKLSSAVTAFSKTSEATVVELERRERRTSKKENDNSRARTELVKDRLVLKDQTERVMNAWKG